MHLDHALRSIAASGPAIQAVHDCKQSLRELRDIYGINTAVLYPEDINVKAYKRMLLTFTISIVLTSPLDINLARSSTLYLGTFSAYFKKFSNALNAMRKALHVFSDVYHDETLITQLLILEKWFMARIL